MPKRFGKDLRKNLADELNIKYGNRVIPGVGLCIALRAIQSVGSPKYIAGTSGMHIKVHFRVIVCRPSEHEVLNGVVAESNSAGIRISLGFFHDVFVPKDELPNPSFYDEEKEVWIWKFDDSTTLYIDQGESVRFRVRETEFGAAQPSQKQVDTEHKPPMRVIGTFSGTGLGVINWWQAEEEEQ
eukprot:CAMPEP_0184479890 /NCGR_PEP_ID=MMETSP0113_2-20130426/1431_1 /TAXON_ID=91329 /ORGANISM="Norrisiella sphaerica, Strain BC52" /LENGTH=183 /DNA_ID=CAMNT_0026858053 /DNA_START=61 /DNA_END=612 /DNA_ORIENTATION=-